MSGVNFNDFTGINGAAPSPRPIPSTQTGSYTITRDGEYILGNTASGDLTISLPASPTPGFQCWITKRSALNILTISGNGANINGSASNLLVSAINNVDYFVYDATYGWVIS